MKNIANILITFVFLLGAFFSKTNAQQLTDENTYLITQYFQQNNNASKLLEDKKEASSNLQHQNSYVKLNQIGNYNQIDIKSKAGDSQIVNQKGNSNNYNFINYYNSNTSEFNISQQGNSNSLEVYGTNSIIKNISILQKADFNTLIIKNY